MAYTTLPKLLNESETAAALGVKRQTLSVWRCLKRVPLPYVKLSNRAIRYREADVQKFLDARVVTPGATAAV